MAGAAISPPTLAELNATLANSTHSNGHHEDASCGGFFGTGGWRADRSCTPISPIGRATPLLPERPRARTPISPTGRATPSLPERPRARTPSLHRSVYETHSASNSHPPQSARESVSANSMRHALTEQRPATVDSARGASRRRPPSAPLKPQSARSTRKPNSHDEAYATTLADSWERHEANMKLNVAKDRVAFMFYRAPDTSFPNGRLKTLEYERAHKLRDEKMVSASHTVHGWDYSLKPDDVHAGIWWGRRRDRIMEYTEAHLNQANVKFRK